MTDAPNQALAQFTGSELFQKIGAICAAVNEVPGAKELLEISLKLTMDLVGAARGSIFIFDEDKKSLVLKIARGMEGADQEMMEKRLGQGVVGQVAASKEPIVVYDIATDKRFLNYKNRSSYRTPSFICAPLLVKDKLIGVISIADKVVGGHFSPNELQLLDFLSSQIALNYRRVQLYQQFKIMEEESERLKAKLGKSSEEANHLKKKIVLHEKLATIGKLAGGIAHEFNNPLDGVMRYTNLCLEQVKDNEVARGYLLEVKHGLNRMANIVKSLLACSRNMNVPTGQIHPNKAFDQAIVSLHAELVVKNIELRKKFANDLRDIADLGLERVLVNLVRNAIDAVSDQGKIEVETRNDADTVVFSVKDNGVGIPTGKIEEVFEPFYTTKDIDKGCGLGLTIVMEIVKNYGGQINVESEPGKETTFTVRIPRQ